MGLAPLRLLPPRLMIGTGDLLVIVALAALAVFLCRR